MSNEKLRVLLVKISLVVQLQISEELSKIVCASLSTVNSSALCIVNYQSFNPKKDTQYDAKIALKLAITHIVT